jgi:hypothetical protein
MLIEFNDELAKLTNDEKLKILLAYHNVPKHFKVDECDIPMIIMALNQDDITSVKVDDEGAIEIGYSGNEWQNQYE